MDKTKLEPVIKLQKLALHFCDKCKQVFRNSSDLKEHSCHCNKQFYKHAFSAYVAVEKMKIHKYDNSTKTFKTKADYLHHKIEDVQANLRKMSAIERTVADGHILKPYQCPDCGIKFAAQSSLDLHSIVHMPYPHVCHCGIGYYKEKDLKSHIKLVHIHTNNKTFEAVKSSRHSVLETQNITETHKMNKDKPVLVEKKKNFKNNVKLKCNKNGGVLKDIKIIHTNDNT